MQAPTFDTAGLNVIWQSLRCAEKKKKKTFDPVIDNWNPVLSDHYPLFH